MASRRLPSKHSRLKKTSVSWESFTLPIRLIISDHKEPNISAAEAGENYERRSKRKESARNEIKDK